ncbi:hypothetical protein [Clostridium pasteurianum]|uniref:Uncharacterized protein n=1 Tax=Clostridium pasteurianum BC1 TaxID=86416 RepID=R4K2I0_CLOPA|nr:hypothetical protein [Clostridium pasteurianum]AGK96788.1 hypothetical protein Clopa_1888 [Clostridium pasteurianum BC1]
MKLFKVKNGFTGFVDVNVLVIAKDEREALESAKLEFRKVVDDDIIKINKQIEKERKKFGDIFADRLKESLRPIYDENYYNNLEIICLCDDVSNEWIGEIE